VWKAALVMKPRICAHTALVLLLGLSAIARPSQSHLAEARGNADEKASATILLYHRFGPASVDSMTIRTSLFAWQMGFLHDKGYKIVPIHEIVAFLEGRGELPPRAVAITVDDGHRTVFTEMKPVVERYRIPVTLFIYPSAISNASYAMTWEQLTELQATGMFDIESHSYWHPNFHIEKRRLPADEYARFVKMQLDKSREVLDRRLNIHVDLLAWPFGIYDDDLIAAASRSGYVAGFTIERRKVSRRENVMTIPRFIVTDRDEGKAFEALLPQDSDSSSSHSTNSIHH